MTKFSVLVSLYCKENPLWFREALDSVFAQTVQPAEIVLVEDGPLTPELYAVIEEYSQKHPIFNIVKNEKNLGLGLALRNGVQAAKYDILARMDTDDVLPTNRFEKQLAMMEDGYDVVSCWSMLYMGNIKNVIAIKQRPEHHDDIVKLAHRRSPVCHAACFMKKSAVVASGSYVHKQYYEDYHLWIRMILNGYKFYNIQESLYYVRTSMNQLGRRGGLAYLKNEIKIFKEFKEMGFYTTKDVLVNSAIRSVARLTPNAFRLSLFKIIWNHKN